MPPLILEGNTLGEKHRSFNKLVHDAVANEQINLSEINYDDSDIQNLLKIHTASKIKNVDYIIKVLKCNDMLYVSTAIKQSTWLITDQEHAHIINPDYLYTQLFPHMLTRAINKLLLHIRLHLKEERRVEGFYNYTKETFGFTEAQKWLVNCSIDFIHSTLQNENEISFDIYKRLCQRTAIFLPYYKKVDHGNNWATLKGVLFMLKSNTHEYFNILDSIEEHYGLPPFGKKYTELVMKKCPERILDNFEKYISEVDLSVVAKCIKKEEIKDFLFKHAQNNNLRHYFSNFTNLKHFIKNMPKEDRFDFVKKIYIDKIENKPATNELSEQYCSADITCLPSCSTATYEWYQFAPFDVAFVQLKKLIRAESSPAQRSSMLSVLITCARNNSQHAKTVLQYYYDKHRNEPFKFKNQFVNNVITKMSTHEFDNETWNILDKLFHSLEVYIESNNNVQICVQCIIIYKVLHNESIPDIIETKISFDTFKTLPKKLNENQKDQICRYLLTSISTKIKNKTIVNESDFNNCYNLLNSALEIIKYWKKDIQEYPLMREKVQEMIKTKKLNSWETNLSTLYDIDKLVRRHLFEESLMLCPSERVCLNALKHDPRLLERYSEEVAALRTNDAVVLRQLLTKLRVYWPQSLAQQWTDAYLNNFDKSTGQKGLITGLLLLFSQKQIIDLAKKHVPKDFKIDWSEIDQKELSLSKNIAKNLYIARPVPVLDVVLSYAKGDYLQYAVPSLNAMLYNLNKYQSRVEIPKLLEAPVSLQKYGLHLAFIKLEYAELKSLFADVWKIANNLTIRTHLFAHTYNMLCKVKEPTLAQDLWTVLSTFINNLTENENKAIFSNLGNAEKIHICVRGEFYMKSYTFFTSLPAAANCENQIAKLIQYGPHIMDLLDSDFVADKMLVPVEEKISKPNCQFINIMSSYVLHGKSEEEQCERFRRILVPALEHAITSWDLVKDQEYVVKENIDSLFKALTFEFRIFLTAKKIIVPIKLFSEISIFLEQKMPIEENYVRITCWKLITEYVKLVKEHQDMLCDKKLNNIVWSNYVHHWLPDDAEQLWEVLHIKLSPKLGPIIVKHLKEDTEKYFSTISWLFTEALSNMFIYLLFNRSIMEIETLKYMVLNEDFIPSYIVVCEEISKYGGKEERKKRLEVRQILAAHPSQEVQMHYKKAFAHIPDTS